MSDLDHYLTLYELSQSSKPGSVPSHSHHARGHVNAGGRPASGVNHHDDQQEEATIHAATSKRAATASIGATGTRANGKASKSTAKSSAYQAAKFALLSSHGQAPPPSSTTQSKKKSLLVRTENGLSRRVTNNGTTKRTALNHDRSNVNAVSSKSSNMSRSPAHPPRSSARIHHPQQAWDDTSDETVDMDYPVSSFGPTQSGRSVTFSSPQPSRHYSRSTTPLRSPVTPARVVNGHHIPIGSTYIPPTRHATSSPGVPPPELFNPNEEWNGIDASPIRPLSAPSSNFLSPPRTSAISALSYPGVRPISSSSSSSSSISSSTSFSPTSAEWAHVLRTRSQRIQGLVTAVEISPATPKFESKTKLYSNVPLSSPFHPSSSSHTIVTGGVVGRRPLRDARGSLLLSPQLVGKISAASTPGSPELRPTRQAIEEVKEKYAFPTAIPMATLSHVPANVALTSAASTSAATAATAATSTTTTVAGSSPILNRAPAQLRDLLAEFRQGWHEIQQQGRTGTGASSGDRSNPSCTHAPNLTTLALPTRSVPSAAMATPSKHATGESKYDIALSPMPYWHARSPLTRSPPPPPPAHRSIATSPIQPQRSSSECTCSLGVDANRDGTRRMCSVCSHGLESASHPHPHPHPHSHGSPQAPRRSESVSVSVGSSPVQHSLNVERAKVIAERDELKRADEAASEQRSHVTSKYADVMTSPIRPSPSGIPTTPTTTATLDRGRDKKIANNGSATKSYFAKQQQQQGTPNESFAQSQSLATDSSPSKHFAHMNMSIGSVSSGANHPLLASANSSLPPASLPAPSSPSRLPPHIPTPSRTSVTSSPTLSDFSLSSRIDSTAQSVRQLDGRANATLQRSPLAARASEMRTSPHGEVKQYPNKKTDSILHKIDHAISTASSSAPSSSSSFLQPVAPYSSMPHLPSPHTLRSLPTPRALDDLHSEGMSHHAAPLLHDISELTHSSMDEPSMMTSMATTATTTANVSGSLSNSSLSSTIPPSSPNSREQFLRAQSREVNGLRARSMIREAALDQFEHANQRASFINQQAEQYVGRGRTGNGMGMEPTHVPAQPLSSLPSAPRYDRTFQSLASYSSQPSFQPHATSSYPTPAPLPSSAGNFLPPSIPPSRTFHDLTSAPAPGPSPSFTHSDDISRALSDSLRNIQELRQTLSASRERVQTHIQHEGTEYNMQHQQQQQQPPPLQQFVPSRYFPTQTLQPSARQVDPSSSYQYFAPPPSIISSSVPTFHPTHSSHLMNLHFNLPPSTSTNVVVAPVYDIIPHHPNMSEIQLARGGGGGGGGSGFMTGVDAKSNLFGSKLAPSVPPLDLHRANLARRSSIASTLTGCEESSNRTSPTTNRSTTSTCSSPYSSRTMTPPSPNQVRHASTEYAIGHLTHSSHSPPPTSVSSSRSSHAHPPILPFTPFHPSAIFAKALNHPLQQTPAVGMNGPRRSGMIPSVGMETPFHAHNQHVLQRVNQHSN